MKGPRHVPKARLTTTLCSGAAAKPSRGRREGAMAGHALPMGHRKRQRRRGELHTIACPNGHTGEAPSPLLLLKESAEPPAILLVPRGASDSDGVSHFESCAQLIKDPERKAQLPRFDDMCLVHAEDVVGIGSPSRQDELPGAVPRLDALVRTAKSSEEAASAPLEEGER